MSGLPNDSLSFVAIFVGLFFKRTSLKFNYETDFYP